MAADTVLQLALRVRDDGSIEAIDRVGGKVRALGSEGAAAGGQLSAGMASAATAAAALGAAIAAAAAAYAKFAVETASQFQDFRTQLETTTGSARAAGQAFDWVKEFAKTTPYDLAGVTEAFVRLKAYGITPTDGTLKTLGDTAAAMGKPLMSAVEALADAVQGEGERLKEFGIKQRVVGEQMVYTWTDASGRVRKTVAENSPEIIRETLAAIWNEKYQGGMDRLASTWSGKMTNVKDAWTNLAGEIGSAVVENQSLLGFLDKVAKKIDGLSKSAADTVYWMTHPSLTPDQASAERWTKANPELAANPMYTKPWTVKQLSGDLLAETLKRNAQIEAYLNRPPAPAAPVKDTPLPTKGGKEKEERLRWPRVDEAFGEGLPTAESGFQQFLFDSRYIEALRGGVEEAAAEMQRAGAAAFEEIPGAWFNEGRAAEATKQAGLDAAEEWWAGFSRGWKDQGEGDYEELVKPWLSYDVTGGDATGPVQAYYDERARIAIAFWEGERLRVEDGEQLEKEAMALRMAQLGLWGGIAGQYSATMRQMYEDSGGEQKKYWEAYKAFAIAETITATASAAMKAAESKAMIPFIGLEAGMAAAALISALGAAKVAMIASQQPAQSFAEGGIFTRPFAGRITAAEPGVGPEAIIPLKRLPEVLKLPPGGGGANVRVTVHQTVTGIGDADLLAQVRLAGYQAGALGAREALGGAEADPYSRRGLRRAARA